MIITSLSLHNWRNIENCSIYPDKGVNVIFGKNAQGKTNLIEALWLCTGLRSFRGAKEAEFVRFGQKTCLIETEFISEQRNRKIEYALSEDSKKILLSGVTLHSPSELCEAFRCVVFSPENLSLIKGAPAARRKFLDAALCQLKPSYRKLINSYRRAVEQRNALLREFSRREGVSYLSDMMDTFENHIAALGMKISTQRQKYIEKIIPFSTEFFLGLSSKSEQLVLRYTGEEYVQEDGAEKLKRELEKSRPNDCRLLTTSVGPHRHDLEISINGISSRNFGSQGQQRSAALALKLAEASLLREFTGEEPAVLLDDVMSELDTGRQDYILNRLEGRQVFITCCDPAPLMKMTGGKAFLAQAGKIQETREI